MISLSRCLVPVVSFLFTLPLIAAAQQSESPEPIGKDLELKACGPKDKMAKYSVETDKSQHPTGTPAADKGLIYVVKPSRLALQFKLAVDGEWKGVNRGYNYFFFMLPPGEHYFCSTDGHTRRTVVLTVEAGKTYYLEQRVVSYGIGWSEDLVPVDNEEGQKDLADTHLSTFKIK